jgi:signal peptidase I
MESTENKDYLTDIDHLNNDYPDSDETDGWSETKNTGRTTSSEKKSTYGAKGLIFDLIFYAVLIFVCVYVLPNYVIQRTIVDGSSMADTLMDGEHLYVEKLSYRFDALDRFDIIVFYPYGRDSEEYYVKRIIGLPGEKIQIIGSDIYINDKILEEDYGTEKIRDPGRAEEPIILGMTNTS